MAVRVRQKSVLELLPVSGRTQMRSRMEASKAESVIEMGITSSENIKLVESCRTLQYRLTTSILSFLARMCLLKLGQPDGGRRTQVKSAASSILIAYNPVSQQLRHLSFSKKISIYLSGVIFIWLGYTAVKLFAMAVLQVEYDRHLNSLSLEVKPNATHSKKCALKEDIVVIGNDEDLVHYNKVIRTKVWMELIGNPIISLHGTCIVLAITYSLIVTAYLHWGFIFLILNQVRFDSLSFIYDPIGERSRILVEFRSLIAVLLSSMKHYADNIYMKEMQQWHRKPCPLSARAEKLGALELERLDRYRQNREASIYTMQVLLEPGLLDTLFPAYLSSESHKRKMSLYYSLTWLMVTNFFTGIFFPIKLVHSEWCVRTMQRLDLLECARWRSNGTLINSLSFLEPLASTEDRESYAKHDGSSLSFLYLSLFVEPKYHLTRYILLSTLEVAMGSILMSFVVSFYTSLYLFSFGDQMVWLDQLNRQIDRSVALILRSQANPDENDSNSSELIRSIMTSYLNFEVFRRHQKDYQHLVSLVFSQPFSITLTTYFLSFLIGSLDKKIDSLPIMVLTSYQSILINALMLSAAHRTHRVECIMKKVTQMLVKSSCLPSNTRLTKCIDLWRRQVLSMKETRRQFAPRVFGLYLSYDQILTFNIYFTALWIIVFRLSF